MKYVRLFSSIMVTMFWAGGSAQTLPQFNMSSQAQRGCRATKCLTRRRDLALRRRSHS
jgi:hypothetical protein